MRRKISVMRNSASHAAKFRVHAVDFEHESLLQTFLDNYRTWAAVWTLRDHTEEFQFS